MSKGLLMDIQNINGYPNYAHFYFSLPTFVEKTGVIRGYPKIISAHLPGLCPLFLQNWACVFCGKIGKN